MTVNEMIGQKLIGGFSGTSITDEFKIAVKRYKVGNVILFRENISDAEQLKRLCRDIQELIIHETGHPAFIMLDQEGGMIARLPAELGNMPGAMAIAATGSPHNAYEAGYYTGKQLLSLGINFNLAPVMDINSNPANPIIGVRSYGDTAETVSVFACEMVRGLSDAGIISCAKHFPGHGDVSMDSHVSLPCVNKSLDELEETELVPFEKAIREGIPAIMSAHILFPLIEKEKIPATMSRTIMTGVLRKKLGFEGLVLSDCLEMQAIRTYYGITKGAVSAAKAGIDLIMVSHTVRYLENAAEAIIKAANESDSARSQIQESAARILRWKERYLRADGEGCSFDFNDMLKRSDALRRKSITLTCKADYPLELGNEPFFVGPSAFGTGLVGNVREDVSASFPQLLQKLLGGRSLCTGANPNDEEIEKALKMAEQSTFVIFTSYNAHLNIGQLKMASAIYQAGKRLAVIALRNPYDLKELPDSIWKYAVYEYTNPMAIAVAEVLIGKESAEGTLPIKI